MAKISDIDLLSVIHAILGDNFRYVISILPGNFSPMLVGEKRKQHLKYMRTVEFDKFVREEWFNKKDYYFYCSLHGQNHYYSQEIFEKDKEEVKENPSLNKKRILVYHQTPRTREVVVGKIWVDKHIAVRSKIRGKSIILFTKLAQDYQEFLITPGYYNKKGIFLLEEIMKYKKYGGKIFLVNWPTFYNGEELNQSVLKYIFNSSEKEELFWDYQIKAKQPKAKQPKAKQSKAKQSKAKQPKAKRPINSLLVAQL